MLGLEPGDPQTFLDWAQFGILGLVIVAALFGWIWFKPAVDRLIHDLDAVTKKLEERDAILRDIVVPAVTESNQLLREVALQLARRRTA